MLIAFKKLRRKKDESSVITGRENILLRLSLLPSLFSLVFRVKNLSMSIGIRLMLLTT